jgi:LPXTG-site transpeptidase (sortase) family protein
MKTRMKTAAIFAIPVLLALTGAFLLYRELDARQIPPLALESDMPDEWETDTLVEPETMPFAPDDFFESPVNEPLTQEETKTPAKAAAQTAETRKAPYTIVIRGKAYPLMADVSETTLKKYIGWMESSAKPGETGVCVVLGHRNRQLRCLKDVVRGDVITIIDEDKMSHAYTVESGRIVEDNNITFAATERPVLVLITCYPFYYNGSAPYQYIVTAIG